MSTRRVSPACRLQLLAVVGVVVTALLGCDPVLRVRGTVHDRTGAPLEGVAIAMKAEGRGPHLEQSAADGSFQVSMVGSARATLAFSKLGYKPAQVPVERDEQVLDVVLDHDPLR